MKKVITISIFLMVSAIGYAVPTVRNATAMQRYPWGLVDITCTVSGVDGAATGYKFALEAVMSESGNTKKGSHFWVVQNGTNSTDRSVHTNGNYRLLWDARTDLGQVHYSNMVLRVNVIDHDKVQLWKSGPYWATTNIGADEPHEYGYYFWWGDTVGYKRVNNAWVASDSSSSDFSFDSSNAPTYYKNIATLKSEGWITTNRVLAPDHDAAHVHWGGNWRMPTKQELSDLNSRCDWTWTTMNGVNGYIVRGKDDYASNSIFLAFAGDGDGTSVGSGGYYWSSVPNSDNDYGCYSWGLLFGSGRHDTTGYRYRYQGQSVRPVQGLTGSAGDTALLLLDTAQPAVDSLPVSWDAAWIGGDANATVVIADNGAEVTRTTGVGEFTHPLSGIGRHDLTYTTYIGGVAQDEVYTATVFKDWKYEVMDGGAVITETTQTSGEVTIPSEIDGFPVTDVASGTFENCSGLTTVYIPQSYTGRTDVFPSATMVIRARQVVTFDAAGGMVSPATNIVEYGSSYGFLPEPSRTGYTFAGWKWNGQSILAETTVAALDNHTLTACWLANTLVVSTPVITPGDGSSFVGDKCLVTISCATDGADIYFSTRGTPPRIRESNRYTGAFEISDTTCVMAIALKENVTSEVAVVTISRRELTIPEAAGAMELTFETGGDADWVPMADVSAASGYSVRSGAIGCASYGTSNVTWLATEVEGMGTFSFRWKVDCEHDYTGMCLWDRLVVFTNVVEAAKIDGSQDWADVSLQFADSGRHSIRWLFLKDDEDDDGASFEDCAWVSGVKWTPAIVVADTDYDIGEMPESVAVQPGVTLSVKVESEPTEGDITALAARVTISPKSPEQNAEYFKVVGSYDAENEAVVLKIILDDDAIELAQTAKEVLDAVTDQVFVGGEVSLGSAKQGLYYGIVVVDDLSKMEAASLDVVFVRAGENGVRLAVSKPQGPSAFFKIVVSDVGNE